MSLFNLFQVAEVIERRFAAVLSRGAKTIFDAEQLVVLRNAVRTGRSAGFDLASVRRNCDVGNRAVFGFAGTVGDYSCVACALRHLDRVERLGQGTDLVDFNEDGVAYAFLNAVSQTLGVRNEQVVANQLNFAKIKVHSI